MITHDHSESALDILQKPIQWRTLPRLQRNCFSHSSLHFVEDGCSYVEVGSMANIVKVIMDEFSGLLTHIKNLTLSAYMLDFSFEDPLT
ncbi:hypothetical protein AVEN_249014-1 [Araneus ventricosus]|uniref:Uncharacterized protein n=1 Tax=Araneus ventricosus TaxID=182803 RepID=A0A4Y2T597_ARAVE|nr:hypothetical protein AVEN_249014-1 [Araneus ventricosus]